MAFINSDRPRPLRATMQWCVAGQLYMHIPLSIFHRLCRGDLEEGAASVERNFRGPDCHARAARELRDVKCRGKIINRPINRWIVRPYGSFGINNGVRIFSSLLGAIRTRDLCLLATDNSVELPISTCVYYSWLEMDFWAKNDCYSLNDCGTRVEAWRIENSKRLKGRFFWLCEFGFRVASKA